MNSVWEKKNNVLVAGALLISALLIIGAWFLSTRGEENKVFRLEDLPTSTEQQSTDRTIPNNVKEIIPHAEVLVQDWIHPSGLKIQLLRKNEIVFHWTRSYEEIIQAILPDETVIELYAELYPNRLDYLPAHVSTTSIEISPLGTHVSFSVIGYEGTREYLVNTKTGEDIIGKSLAYDHGWPLWPKDESFLVLQRAGIVIDGTAPAVFVSQKNNLVALSLIYEGRAPDDAANPFTIIRDLTINGNLVTFAVVDSDSEKGTQWFSYDVEKQSFVK